MNRRRHRGIPRNPPSNQLQIDWNVSDRQPAAPLPLTASLEVLTDKSRVVPLVATAEEPPPSFVANVRRSRGAIAARFPVPRPLPAAVAAGRFGYDENQRPICPDADEVGAITESQTTKLIDMLEAMTPAPGKPAVMDSLPDAFHAIIAAYAQDFGEHAAQQLEAYARRQASLEESERADQGWRR
jgi:hypothetical protein